MNKLKLWATLILALVTLLHPALADDPPQVDEVTLNQENEFTLTREMTLTGYYDLVIPKGAVPKNDDRWYLFVLAEPIIEADETIGSPSRIELKKINSKN